MKFSYYNYILGWLYATGVFLGGKELRAETTVKYFSYIEAISRSISATPVYIYTILTYALGTYLRPMRRGQRRGIYRRISPSTSVRTGVHGERRNFTRELINNSLWFGNKYFSKYTNKYDHFPLSSTTLDSNEV